MSNPVICFDFTANNMHPNICKEMLNLHCRDWMFQQEKAPTTGTLHLQGRFRLKVKARLETCVKKFPGCHLSITSKENSRNNFYVMKEDTRVAGPWSSEDTEIYIPKQVSGITLKPWQQYIVNDANVWDTRTINIIVDKNGSIGKSTLCTYIGCHQIGKKIPFANDFRDIMQMVMCMDTQKLYIFDLPRALRKDQLYQFYGGIEEIKNGYAFDTRYHFKEKYFDCPNIWIFSNKYPDMDMLSMDRWKIWKVEDDNLLPYSTIPVADENPKPTSTVSIPKVIDPIDEALDNITHDNEIYDFLDDDEYYSWDVHPPS